MNNLSKSELRLKFKNVRNSINTNTQEEKSKVIEKFFIENFSTAQNYFVYLSFGDEVRTGDILKHILNKNKNVAIPKCNIEKLTMKAVRYRTDDFLTKNSYGIFENDTDDCFEEKIDVILMPALTVDRYGNRIGFGKGYYDKFINSLDYKPILIGLCYAEQVFEGKLPSDEYDKKLDYIITDQEIIKICEK